MNDIEALLDLLPRLEDPERSFAPIIHEPGGSTRTDSPDGLDDPWVEWPTILSELATAIRASGLIQDFDWMGWDAEGRRYYEEPTLLKAADLDIVEKLLTLHLGINQAVPGHLAGVCRNGHMQAVLRRLRELVRAED